jgi:hypothetical protein
MYNSFQLVPFTGKCPSRVNSLVIARPHAVFQDWLLIDGRFQYNVMFRRYEKATMAQVFTGGVFGNEIFASESDTIFSSE